MKVPRHESCWHNTKEACVAPATKGRESGTRRGGRPSRRSSSLRITISECFCLLSPQKGWSTFYSSPSPVQNKTPGEHRHLTSSCGLCCSQRCRWANSAHFFLPKSKSPVGLPNWSTRGWLTTRLMVETEDETGAAARATVMSLTNATGRCDHHMVLGDHSQGKLQSDGNSSTKRAYQNHISSN